METLQAHWMGLGRGRNELWIEPTSNEICDGLWDQRKLTRGYSLTSLHTLLSFIGPLWSSSFISLSLRGYQLFPRQHNTWESFRIALKFSISWRERIMIHAPSFDLVSSTPWQHGRMWINSNCTTSEWPHLKRKKKYSGKLYFSFCWRFTFLSSTLNIQNSGLCRPQHPFISKNSPLTRAISGPPCLCPL